MLFGERRKKVAIVIGQLAYGGAERQVVLLAKGLKRSDEFALVVFCLSERVEPNGDVLSNLGIEWYSTPERVRSSFDKLRWLIRQVKLLDCSLLYGILNIGNIYAGATAEYLRLPLIGSIRNTDVSLPPHIRALSGLFCKRACIVIANSESSLRSLRKDLYVRHPRVYVIPNAVEEPPEFFEPEVLRSDWKVPGDALVIGTIALLKKQKRPDYFIKVAKLIPEEWNGKSLHLVWIGEGPERKNIEKWLATTSPSQRSRIHFPGARNDVAACLAAFDVFVLTSAYEGMPNALLEAMSAGLPSVVTNVVGTRDVLMLPLRTMDKTPNSMSETTEICVLSDPDDPKKFSDDIMELLRNPSRMKLMGDSARQYVQSHYSLNNMIQKHCEVFGKVLIPDN